MNTDAIFRNFLERQHEEGMALAAASDVLELMPLPGDPISRYIAVFRGKWITQEPDGHLGTAPLVAIGIQFPADYLRSIEASRVVSILDPLNLFHPNIRGVFVCLGRMTPGTGLVDLIYQSFELLCFHKFSSHDSLSEEAAQWTRNAEPQRFPIDRRPLRRSIEKGATR